MTFLSFNWPWPCDSFWWSIFKIEKDLGILRWAFRSSEIGLSSGRITFGQFRLENFI